jgi:hypothetical protein
MSEEKRKDTVAMVHEIEDDGNYQRTIKTRLSQIHRVQENITSLIDFCENR